MTSTRIAAALAGALTIAVLAAGLPPAHAAPVLEPIATERIPSPLSAYAGRMAWSRSDDDRRYRLVTYAGGRARVAPVPSRRAPFDVDLGPDARGRVVAVYSRCRDEDSFPPKRCDLYRHVIGSAGEEKLRGPSTRRGSEHDPSLWRGRLAFARDETLVVRSAAGAERIVRSRGRLGEIELHGRHLAFRTTVIRPPVRAASFAAIDLDEALRLADLDQGTQRRVERHRFITFGPEAFSPSFARGRLYYGFTAGRSQVRRFDPRTGRRARAKVSGPLVSVERDGRATRAIFGEDRKATSGQPCSIGVTDFISPDGRERTCAIGTLRGLRFVTR